MKKTMLKKLRLDASTIRALSAVQANDVSGGDVSVGTCTGCRHSYCDDCPELSVGGKIIRCV